MQADSIIQNIFTVFKNIKWRECETDARFEWSYAESMHYVVHDKVTNAYWFIKGKSPSNACEIAMKKVEQ